MDIIAQPLASTLLQAMTKADAGSDAYKQSFLFFGPAGTGKLSAAMQFAKAAMFGAAAKQSVANASDLLVLEPASGREYAVEQIRELNNFLTYKPQTAARRVAILQNAEKLNPSSVGAFLKSLEEPPGSSMIILLADSKSALTDTIVSRCYLVPFIALAEDAAVAELMQIEQLDEPSAKLALALSGNSPLAAKDFWKSESRRALRQDVIAILLDLPTCSVNDLCIAVSQLTDKHKLTRPKQADSEDAQRHKLLNRQFDNKMHLLYISICLFYLDAIKALEQGDKAEILNFDYLSNIRDFVQTVQAEQAKPAYTSSLTETARLFGNLVYNINSEVQITALFISLRKIIHT